ncbi:hypothetical protein G6F31_016680 [Rhizopus arrhizus]|nr:hypothetical protein G6F31_016680 [Rhizopus arrhizus]
MMVTSTSRASSDWLATWPKRPKPISSTLPDRPSASSTPSMFTRHRQHHHGGEVGIDVQVDHAGRCGGGEQHEGELAALRHQHATVQRLRVVAAHDARDHVDAQRLGRHQRQHQAEDQLPVRGHHAQVQRHAHAEEEQAEQDAAERFDVRFDLVAEGRLAQQHAGQEGAEAGAEARFLHEPGGAQHHQQGGGAPAARTGSPLPARPAPRPRPPSAASRS